MSVHQPYKYGIIIKTILSFNSDRKYLYHFSLSTIVKNEIEDLELDKKSLSMNNLIFTKNSK